MVYLFADGWSNYILVKKKCQAIYYDKRTLNSATFVPGGGNFEIVDNRSDYQ